MADSETVGELIHEQPETCCGMPVSFSGTCLGECGKVATEEADSHAAPIVQETDFEIIDGSM